MAVFLPIVPNWQNGVRDTYEFKTNVFVTRDGSEQRRSERIQPRRKIDVAVLLDGERKRVFSDALHMARDGKVEIADFSADAAMLTDTVADGGALLKIDHAPAWLHDSMTCVLLSGRQARKITIDFVEGNQVVLVTGLVGSVGGGAQLLPFLPASLGNTNTMSLYTTLVSTSALTFEIEPGTTVREADDLPIDNSAGAETTQVFGPAAIFYGRYVLLRKPNYLQAPQMAFNLPFQTVDYDRGVTKTFTPVPQISRTLTATYTALSHADAMAILDIFIRTKGRAGEIFVPTWSQDLPAVTAVSGKNIRVSGTDLFNAYGDDPAYRALLIRKTDGTLIPHDILSMTTDAGDTLITTSDPIGATIGEISQISWMFVARFATDALTIQWLSNGLATIALSFTTLANLAAEDSFGNNWILATGYWRDGGVWHDTANWID